MKEPLLMSEKKYSRKYIGKEFTTNEGYTAKVIDGGTKPGYCTIQIEDWVKEVQVSHIKRGVIKYPYHPSVFNVGYVGEGKYPSKEYKNIYTMWNNMLDRCYNPVSLKNNPTYIGTTVCKEWHNFQNFAKWFERYYPRDGNMYELDKDLLKGKSKVYSPKTCVFLPYSLNKFMTNIQSNNTSGHVGVSWDKRYDKWMVNISIDNKYKFLGQFVDIEKASKVYKQARDREVKRWQNYYSFDYPKYVLDRLK